jgi:hypothetical protein
MKDLRGPWSLPLHTFLTPPNSKFPWIQCFIISTHLEMKDLRGPWSLLLHTFLTPPNSKFPW